MDPNRSPDSKDQAHRLATSAVLGWLADGLTVVGHEADLASELGLEQAAFTTAVASLVRAKLVMLGGRGGLIWLRALSAEG